MVKKFKVTLPSLTGAEKRWAYVYLPTMYRTQPRRRFPVLYMFDGHNVFFDDDATYGKSWGLAEYLDFVDAPIIVAAVECNHHPDGGRLSEYSPFDFEYKSMGKVNGRGHLTMNWFTKAFKPYIDKRFRTIKNREHTFIAGSSMGGLMTMYAVTKYNHIFSRGAALSPSVWVDPSRLVKMIEESDIQPETVLYMDYGSKELVNHQGQAFYLRQVADAFFDKGVYLNARIVPGGNHSEASWEQQIPFFMDTLLYGLER